MTTRQLYDQLEMHTKAMRMKFKLAIIQLIMAIRENNDRVLTDIISD